MFIHVQDFRIYASVPGEYEFPSSRDRSPSQGPPKQNAPAVLIEFEKYMGTVFLNKTL
jgi:hypothetical protein